MRLRKIVSALIAVSCLAVTSAVFADGLAVKLVDENGNGNSNKQIDIYPLMTIDDDFNVSGLVNSYNAIAETENMSDDEAAESAARTMASYVIRDKVPAAASQLTDSNGIAKFDNLSSGVYLVIDPEYYTDRYRYATAPYAVQTTEDNSTYVTLDPVIKKMSDSVSSVRYVTVDWDMSTGSPATIPESVTLQVLKNGNPYGSEVKITAADGWSYMFEDMSLANSWSIMEKDIPYGFAVNISDNGRDVRITNVASPSMSEITALGSAMAKGFAEGLGSEYMPAVGEIAQSSYGGSYNEGTKEQSATVASKDGESKITENKNNAAQTATTQPSAKPSASPSANPKASPSASPDAKNAKGDTNSPKTGDNSNAPLLICLAVLLCAAAGMGVWFVFFKKPNGVK